MPLLDHFHSPLSAERRWESFHSSWATRLADALTERWLPPNYLAEEHAHLGPSTSAEGSATVATVGPKVWPPPAADGVLAAVFPDTFEVRVLCTDTGPKLVAAIELISPGNKDRVSERRAFAIKCASYLYQGISVVIVDIVTNRRANLLVNPGCWMWIRTVGPNRAATVRERCKCHVPAPIRSRLGQLPRFCPLILSKR